MGLDSIELVIKIEKYFDIQIPDPEAEKIYTVQDMVDTVARHLHITSNDAKLRDRVFSKIAAALSALNVSGQSIQLQDCISKYILPGDKEIWKSFQKSVQLDIPKPNMPRHYGNKLTGILSELIRFEPNYNWNTLSAEAFTDAVCASNYNTLLNRKNIQSKYEIYIVVSGITVDQVGVDYYEITPGKSFTDDFGVD